MGLFTTPKDFTVPVPFVDRDESFDLTADGPYYDPKSFTVPMATVDHEESFDQTTDGPHFNTKSCHRSHGGCRARRELRSNAR
ncbi:hypothetical protein L484_000440 [Morus notabilis]|uniref:Uncharacterized protein n=1 Tax=Morus notabilis TaxID=981085 RepID=W9RTA6_9ROSA|nr:hypothetical protein L484_000440 [Morus notabilis]